jgi:hypothetical protein
MASEHETRAPHPPLYPRLQATRFKLQESNIRSGRIPVVFDELSTLVAEGGATGIDECINEAIEAITQELHLKQKQQLKVHQLQCKSLTAQPCSPQAIKHTSDNKSTSSSPRRSPARQAIAHSATFAKSDDPLPSEDVLTHCLFCVAACQESKQRRERSLATIMNPLTGNELSPGGALPMRTPVATCDRCNGGVCEFHIMLHSVKMPGHWDALTFYDSAVDSAYRSLPPHAQLLSRVMLRCTCNFMFTSAICARVILFAALTRSASGLHNKNYKCQVHATRITKTEMCTNATLSGTGRTITVLRYLQFWPDVRR